MANRRFIDFPIAASVGDNDIVLIWQDGLNKQTTKSTLFAGSPSTLASLTDVDISALTNGQILQYNSTTSKWENVDRTDIDLDQLGDVTIVSPTNGQVLVYNSSTSKWENSSGGFVPYTGAVTTVNLGAQSILAGTFVKAGGTSAQFLKADGSVDSTAYGTGSVTSVGLTMPSAFNVASSPVTTNGTIAVTGAGTTAQYIRGDGSLASFPSLTGFVPYTGATADVDLGTHDLTAERGTFANNGSSDTLTVNHTSGSGYGIIVTKGGNNEALYVSKTSGSGNAMTVVGGRTSLVDLALSSVSNTAGDFLTLSGGVVHKRTAAEVRTDIGAGTVTSVGLSSATSGVTIGSTPVTTSGTITLAIATASGSQNGLLSSTDWTTFNNKQNALTNPVTGTGTTNYLPKFTGTSTIGNSNLINDANGNLGLGVTPSAWGSSTFKVLDIGSTTSLYYDGGTILSENSFINSSFQYIYKTTNFASRYDQVSGQHRWFNAPSGTAGNAISFTQAMTLGSNSGLSIGTPSAAPSQGLLVQGNVGIGTSPSFKLDVNGKIYSSTEVQANNAVINTTGGYATFGSNSSAVGVRVGRDAFFDDIIINTGGNVSIGTTSDPGFKLNVAGTGRFSGGDGTRVLEVTTGGETFTRVSGNRGNANDLHVANLEFYNSNSTRLVGEIRGITGTGGTQSNSGQLAFYTNDAGTYTERMRITSGGNVGIGTASPSARLEVSDVGATIVSRDTNGYTRLSQSNGSAQLGLFRTGTGAGGFYIGGDIDLFSVWSSSFSRLFNVTSGGNVLINTATDAGFKLDVNGTGRFSGALLVSNNDITQTGTRPILSLQQSGTTKAFWGISDGVDDLVNGASSGDAVFRKPASSGAFRWTVDGGSTSALVIASTGAATFSSSVTAASFIPSGSTIPTNGMYLPSANTIAFSTNTTQRISVSSAGEVQLKQSSNSAQNSVIFNTTIQNAMTLNSSGFLILNGTTGSSRITCYGDGYFSGGIQTGNPYGSTSANWLLGRFLTETTSANGSIRVQIGSKYYNIAAEDLGEVPT
jgi:hypothetical protein